MVRIETILCPVEATHPSGRALALASSLARLLGARIVFQHDVGDEAPGMIANSWMDARESAPRRRGDEETAAKALDGLLAKVPPGVFGEARLTRGPRALAILHLAAELPAQLIVMATHGRNNPEQASLTERVLDGAPCPVLATHLAAKEDEDFPEFFALQAGHSRMPIVVPVDFTPHSEGAARYAFELATSVGLEVHLVEVENRFSWDDMAHLGEMSLAEHRRQRVREARERLEALIPADLVGKVRCDVDLGKPNRCILDHARRENAALIVMGVHPKGPVEKLVTGATSCDVLRDSPCPVWFVPAAVGALMEVPELAGVVG